MKEARDSTPSEAKALGKRLRELRNAAGMKPEDIGKTLDLGPDAVKSHEIGRRRVSRDQAVEYAKAYGSTPEYILFGTNGPAEDTRGSGPWFRTPAQLAEFVPVYGPVAGATPDRVLFTEDFIVSRDPCPTELQRVKGAFRMYVQGDSMAPRHEPGEKISVNPHQFPLTGQDCVAILEPDGNAILKRYLGSTDREYKLRQLNPLKDFTLRKNEVRAIYAVVR